MGRTLRLLSANLCNGRAHAEAFADLVLAQAVDVAAVQEISPEQAEALSAVLPHGELEPARDYTGMGIVMRRPGAMSRLTMACRDARVAQLDPSHWPQLPGPLEILNIHLMAPLPWQPFSSFRKRRQQISVLRRHLVANEAPHRAVLGDFNATPRWPAYRHVAEHLRDAAVAAAERLGDRALPTWGPWAGAPRLARIDHGFVAGLEVERFQVLDLPGSDHSAIVMDVVATPAKHGDR